MHANFPTYLPLYPPTEPRNKLVCILLQFLVQQTTFYYIYDIVDSSPVSLTHTGILCSYKNSE